MLERREKQFPKDALRLFTVLFISLFYVYEANFPFNVPPVLNFHSNETSILERKEKQFPKDALRLFIILFISLFYALFKFSVPFTIHALNPFHSSTFHEIICFTGQDQLWRPESFYLDRRVPCLPCFDRNFRKFCTIGSTSRVPEYFESTLTPSFESDRQILFVVNNCQT